MKKRIILAILLMFTLLFCACSETEQVANENLLENPGFENGTGVQVEGWYLERYDTTSPIENYQAIKDDTVPTGENALKIESVGLNDARYMQEVEVEPDSYYCLSAMVKTELIETNGAESGASIGIFDSPCRSYYVYGNTDWTNVTVYGKTGPDTESVKIALRLGNYGADASGIAYFDDVTFSRVDELPENVTALSMDKAQQSVPQQNNGETEKDADPDDVTVNVTVTGVLLFLALGVFLFWAYKELNFKMKHLYIFIGAAVIIRFIAAVMYAGFMVDIKCFAFWGNTMADYGMSEFYASSGFCDYPPLYMIVLGFVNSVAEIFGVDIAAGVNMIEHAGVTDGAGAALIFLKSPAIICDALSAFVLALIAKKHVGEKLAVILGIGYAFLPTAIVNAGLWGQVDSVLVLFMLLTFWLIDRDQFGYSVLTYFVGILLKPQAILFGPVMLLAAIHEFYVIYLDFSDGEKKSAYTRLIKGFGALAVSIGFFFLLSAVMNPGEAYVESKGIEGNWLIGLYTETLGSYDYATLSSFGLMGLLGGQWKESSMEAMDGISYGDLGTALLWIVIALVVGIFAFLLSRAIENNSKGKGGRAIQSGWFWVLGALMVAGAVTVSTRTHERYMFPVIIMLVMGYVHFKEIKLLIIAFGYAFLNFINTAGLMFLYEETGQYFANSSDYSAAGVEVPLSGSIFDIGSFLTVALFVFQIYVTISLMFKKGTAAPNNVKTWAKGKPKTNTMPIKPDSPLVKLYKRRNYHLPKVTWKVIAICVIITVVYGCFAFTNLGDIEAAQTFWYTDKTEVYVVADLGEVNDFDEIKYLSYSGRGEVKSGAVKVYLSEDGENYTPSGITEIMYSDEWQTLHGAGRARYIKIAVASQISEYGINGVNIREIVVLKDNVPLKIKEVTESVVPVESVSGAGKNLFDAQDSYFAEPEEPAMPETFWQTEGEYILNLNELVSIYEVKAYFKESGKVTLSVEDNGVWKDIFVINAAGEGWAEGERVVSDEEVSAIASIKIKNHGVAVGELFIGTQDASGYREVVIREIYKAIAEVEDVITEGEATEETPADVVTEGEVTEEIPADVITEGEVADVTEDGVYDTTIYKAEPITEDDEIYNCFDERDTLDSGKQYPGGKSWSINSTADYVIADFGEVKDVYKGYYRTSLTNGNFKIYFSEDGTTWNLQNNFTVKKDEGQFYYWYNLSVYGRTRYVLITAETPYLKLIEVGFFESEDAETTIPVKEVITNSESGYLVFDEQDLVPAEGATYMNSMYFDEIYHARTAYESATGQSIYEWTHPPLGKDFMSWCVSSMGMTPFAWRFAGAMAGVLMVPAMFFLGFLMFRKTSWATVTALLMAFDGMHYEQTRIATIDSFGVLFIILMFLFMYWYQSLSFYDVPLKKTFIPLGLCGLSFGLGAASKWICLYAGAGLAVIFFMTMIRRWREYTVAVENIRKASGEEKKYLMHIRDNCLMNTVYTLLFCIVVFIVIPLIIYCLSYYPYWNAETETRAWYDIILSNQEEMFNYHSNLTATHPFQSNWYTWPTMEKPMWFYSGPQTTETMSAIYAFGNPIVWWTGLFAALAGIGILISRLFESRVVISEQTKGATGFFGLFKANDEDAADCTERDTRTLIFLALGALCNLIPWMGVTRCIFIYHYFATVPFIILFTVYILRHISRKNVKIGAIITIALVVMAIVTFLMFLPVWTGTPVSREYVDTWLRWKEAWFKEYFPQG